MSSTSIPSDDTRPVPSTAAPAPPIVPDAGHDAAWPLGPTQGSSSSTALPPVSVVATPPPSLAGATGGGDTCRINLVLAVSSDQVLRSFPQASSLNQCTRAVQSRDLRAGALFLLGVEPDAILVIRFNPDGRTQAVLAIDGTSPPRPAAQFPPLLSLTFAFVEGAAPITLQVVSDSFVTMVTDNPRLAGRVHHATIAPMVSPDRGWFTTSSPPTAAPVLAGPLSPLVSTGPLAYPLFSVHEKLIAFRRSGPSGVGQQIVDSVNGIAAVAKDHMRQHGLSDATVRAISAAPEAALFAQTLSGTYAYIYRVTRCSIPQWDFDFFIGHSWQFPTDFDIALLSPLTLAFPAGPAQEAFQRELHSFDLSKKKELAVRFATVAPYLLGHDVSHLRCILHTYLHIVFVVTLMHEHLQRRALAAANALVGHVECAFHGPYPLTRMLLIAAFHIFRDGFREFLAQSGASIVEADLQVRLAHFEDQVTSLAPNGYLAPLFRAYGDLHLARNLHGPFLIEQYRIVPGHHPAPAASPKPQSAPTPAPARGKSGKKKTPASAAASVTPSVAASTAEVTPQTPVATSSLSRSPTATAASGPRPAHLCAAFNGVNGCRRFECPNEHVCPVRSTDRWNTLYAYLANLHFNQTLRNPPSPAYLQGATWPPTAAMAAAPAAARA